MKEKFEIAQHLLREHRWHLGRWVWIEKMANTRWRPNAFDLLYSINTTESYDRRVEFKTFSELEAKLSEWFRLTRESQERYREFRTQVAMNQLMEKI
jgi:hypothetical protein